MSVRVVIRGKLGHEAMRKVLNELRKHSKFRVETEEASENEIVFYEDDKPKIVFLGTPEQADWIGFMMAVKLLGDDREKALEELRARGIVPSETLKQKLTENHWVTVFTAPWCLPCMYQVALCVSFVAQTRARLMIINIEERMDLAERFNIQAVPYTVVKLGDPIEGKEIYSQLGFMDWDAFVENLERSLSGERTESSGGGSPP